MPDESPVTAMPPPPPAVVPRWSDRFTPLLSTLEIDRAVFYSVAARILQIAGFPVTMVLIARCLTPQLQGFYYTFGSVLSLQMFVELGFTYVIVNVASHEWAHLSLDENGFITGDAQSLSRLVSLGRLIFRWYAVAALLFVAGAVSLGWYFFSRGPGTDVRWEGPLIGVVVVSGFLLWALPFNALLEGCNQVANINRLRLTQTVLESAALWVTLLLGGGLWAAAAAITAKLLRDLYLVFVEYRNFFKPFFDLPLIARVSWRNEIWPMQWRLALAGVAMYFASALYNPVMFRYHGPSVAGQMGMTLQMVTGMQLIPMAWVLTKAPRYGMLIAQKNYEALDRLWLRNSLISLGIVIAGASCVWLVVYLLNISHAALAQRMLSPAVVALFLCCAVLLQAVQCFVAYLRAHKREPILAANITTATVAGLLVWFLGSRLGPTGAAIGNVVQMLLTFFWIGTIWWRRRAEWHGLTT